MQVNIYVTWVTTAFFLGFVMMPLLKPKWSTIRLSGFIDMLRRYWAHMLLMFSIYLWKDLIDTIDRTLMANTQLEITPFVYAIEGDLVLQLQQYLLNDLLTVVLTHFYIVGYMLVCIVSILYLAYFNDRWLADRVALSVFLTYMLAIPFYLFLNVQVTGDHIPEMQTLAYDLTPEISDWFARVDPFTNGWPSLHIGVPFVIWLTLLRYDTDRRWLRYRIFLGAYLLLTAFTILYLGIHWFSDILVGMGVAYLALILTERWQNGVWTLLDERTIGPRLISAWGRRSLLLSAFVKKIGRATQGMTSPRNWNSGVAIMLVLLVTGLVLLWDVTHQQIPVTSAPQPTAAEGSEGWVVVVGKTSEGGVIFIAHNLTHFTEHQLETPSLDEGFQFAVASHWVVVANNTQVRLIDLATEYKEDYEVENVSHLALGFQMDGTPVIVSSTDAGLFGMVMGGGNITLPTPPGKIMDLEIHNNRLAMVCADKPDTIRLGWLGSDILSEFQPDPRATPEEDLFLLEHGGVEVNYSTIRVVNITLDERWVVAAVNVTAVDRLVMFDQLSGEIRLLGDPKYPVCEPDVGHGIVTWSAQRFLDPLHPDKAMLDHDIWFHNIETNRTILIPDEDDVDQRFPHSLSNHITWMEYSSGNEKLIIFPIEKPLEGYSSITLQVTVLLLLPLVTLHTWRRSVGWRASIPHKNE